MCLYRVLASRVTILKRCDSAFVPVPSAAPKARHLGHSVSTSLSPVHTESIGEHLEVVTGIGDEVGNAMSTHSGP